MISANPKGKAPVATLGIASKEPLPGEISTSKPADLKYPLSMALKKGADGPSNFQSRVKGILVSAITFVEKVKKNKIDNIILNKFNSYLNYISYNN